MSDRPSYVKHDDVRWYVVRETKIDGEPAYVLRKPRGRGKPPVHIVARVSECEPWRAPTERIRKFSDGEHVLEIRTAGDEIRGVQGTARAKLEAVRELYRLDLQTHRQCACLPQHEGQQAPAQDVPAAVKDRRI